MSFQPAVATLLLLTSCSCAFGPRAGYRIAYRDVAESGPYVGGHARSYLPMDSVRLTDHLGVGAAVDGNVFWATHSEGWRPVGMLGAGAIVGEPIYGAILSNRFSLNIALEWEAGLNLHVATCWDWIGDIADSYVFYYGPCARWSMAGWAGVDAGADLVFAFR